MAKGLKAVFLYTDDLPNLAKLPSKDFAGLYELPVAGVAPPTPGALAVEIGVALAGKAVESLLDAVAAATQPQATTLDVTIPLDGFYDSSGGIAVENGFLIFHNGPAVLAHADATIKGSFRIVPSTDRTAFRFEVFHWDFRKFLGPKPGLFQGDARDLAIKIEFLSPGASDLGTRAAFFERVFSDSSAESLKSALSKDEKLPWLACPVKVSAVETAAGAKSRCLPLNVRITVVETTRPNQFATWVREIAKEQKADISTSARNIARASLDNTYAATEGLKRTQQAAAGYEAYATAWREANEFEAKKPAEPSGLPAWQAALAAKVQETEARRRVACATYRAADLNWPGDLPPFKAPK